MKINRAHRNPPSPSRMRVIIRNRRRKKSKKRYRNRYNQFNVATTWNEDKKFNTLPGIRVGAVGRTGVSGRGLVGDPSVKERINGVGLDNLRWRRANSSVPPAAIAPGIQDGEGKFNPTHTPSPIYPANRS